MNENKGYIIQIIQHFRTSGFPNPEFRVDYGFCIGLLNEIFPRATDIVAIFISRLTKDDLEGFARSGNPLEALIMELHSFVAVWFGER